VPGQRGNIRVRADPHRSHAAWAGGSVLANIDSFQNEWLAKWEYEEARDGGGERD
jgi:actin-related protein